MSCVFRKKLLQFALLIALIAVSTTSDGVTQAFLAKCLPADIKLSDIVEATSARYASGRASGVHKITVEDKLNELKATCSDDNKLVDGNGKQIMFYHLTGCWGNPPADYQEILQKQRDELQKLKQQYTVIEMTCNLQVCLSRSSCAFGALRVGNQENGGGG